MTDFDDFGEMKFEDRGGDHEYHYEDGKNNSASFGLTPSQTVGPFFAFGLTPSLYGYAFDDIHASNMASADMDTDAIIIEGQVFDGAGNSIHDAFIELVQADPDGNYIRASRNDAFTGFGRCGTGSHGPEAEGGDTRFQFRTIKPGSTRPDAAPSITVIVAMRGLMNHCITRLYFSDDDHSVDSVLAQVPEERRHTLIAQKSSANSYTFDIHMQGENETVFFDI